MEPRAILDNLVDVSAGCICIASKEGECICSKEKVKALSFLASWVRGKKDDAFVDAYNDALESIAKDLEG